MKRIALIIVGLAALALAGVAGHEWWQYNAAKHGAQTAAPDRVIGNPQGSLTIVEFVDYQCPYCLTMHQRLREAMGDDKDIRLVYRALPWLRDSGEIAAFVVATRAQGKEVALHQALLSEAKPANILVAKRIATTLGVDVQKAEQDQGTPEVLGLVTDNLNYALALHLQSTPALLIGSTLYVPTPETMPSTDELRRMIAAEKGKN